MVAFLFILKNNFFIKGVLQLKVVDIFATLEIKIFL